MKKHLIAAALPALAATIGDKAGVKVFIGGETACTNGKFIIVPTLPAESIKARTLAAGYITHEGAHVRFTDFTHTGGDPLHHKICNIIEDGRVEKLIGDVYPGARINLNQMLETLAKDNGFNTKAENPAKVFAGWLMGRVRIMLPLGQKAIFKEFDDVMTVRVEELLGKNLLGSVESALKVRLPLLKNTADTRSLASDLLRMVKDRIAELQKEEEEKKKKETQQNGQKQDGQKQASNSKKKGTSKKNAKTKSQQDNGDANGSDDQSQQGSGSDTDDGDGQDTSDQGQQSQGGDDGGNAQQDASGSDSDSGGDTQQGGNPKDGDDAGQGSSTGQSGDASTGQAPQSSTSSGQGSGAGSGSDEKIPTDQLIQALKDLLEGDAGNAGDIGSKIAEILTEESEKGRIEGVKMCWETEHADAPMYSNPAVGKKLLQEVRVVSNALRTRLHRFMEADGCARRGRGMNGNDLSTRHLHKVATGDPKVFRKKRPDDRPDTAVAILVDRSGSMGYQGSNRITKAMQAGLAVTEALAKLDGVAVTTAAFPGNQTHIMPLCGFNENPVAAAGRFMPTTYGSTPMAQAISWATREMENRPETRKILFVVTDGDPDDREPVVGQIEDLQAAGYEVMGIGVETPIAKTLFPINRTINDVGELTSAMFEMLQERLLTR